MNETKQTAKNTVMLYFLTIAKMIFPLATLPYLTRVLSTDCYGVVSYVKAVIVYMQLIIDFGFILSAVKDIVKAKGDKESIGRITGNVFVAKSFLAIITVIISVALSFILPILRPYKLFTFLYSLSIALSALLADFLFRGIEKMHLITIIFVIMKGISTALTFVFVKNDATIIWIPILEIVSTIIAVAITWIIISKLGYKIRFSSFRDVWSQLKESAIYFLSRIATTAFGALNTLLIGIVITDATQIAYWSVCMQLVTAVQSLYQPIMDGIYPQMVRQKSLKFIKKILLIFMPIVVAGCIFCYFVAGYVLKIVGGEEYVVAKDLFRAMIPILFLSFPSVILGWPTLGPIDKEKEVTISTIITAIVQIAGLGILILINRFYLIELALLRGLTELIMLCIRLYFVIKYRNLFDKGV